MSELPFELLDDVTAPVPTEDVSIMRAYDVRDYQAKAIAGVAEGRRDPAVRAQLLCMATGTGKTVVFAALSDKEVSALVNAETKGGGRALILAHTDELCDQAIDKIKRRTKQRPAKEKADCYASRFDLVVVGSVQTLMGDLRLSSWPQNHFTLIVVDEAHRSLAESYQKILKHFMAGGAHVIGVTATPDRGDKRTLGEFYQRIAFEYNLRQAVRDGWLVRPVFKAMPLAIDLKGVQTKQTVDGADLDRMEVGRRLQPYLKAIAEIIRKEAGNKRVLIFLPSVETAKMMSDELNAVGITSDWVCGDKKLCPDRKEKVARHKRGEFQAMCNMAILTEGYDDDGIDIIVPLRATKLRGLWSQIIGRGTRPHESIVKLLNAAANALERCEIIKNSCKPVVTVLDFLFLHDKHQLCTSASLVTVDERVAELMAGKSGDTILNVEQAERDLLAKLADDLKKNANRAAKVVDPLAFSVELGDTEMSNYQPLTARDAREPSERQLAILKGNGLDVSKVTAWGHAQLLVGKILQRHGQKLATVRQLHFFKGLGVDASTWTREKASIEMDAKLRHWDDKKADKAAEALGRLMGFFDGGRN